MPKTCCLAFPGVRSNRPPLYPHVYSRPAAPGLSSAIGRELSLLLAVTRICSTSDDGRAPMPFVYILVGIIIGLALGVIGAVLYIRSAANNALASARNEAQQIKENASKEAQNKAKEIELTARQQQ